GACLLPNRGQRLDVRDDARRRLRVDDPERLRAAGLAQAGAYVLGLRDLAPRVPEMDDVGAVRRGHLRPPLAEVAGRDDEVPLAGRDEVRDRRLEGPGARRAEEENVGLRAR